MTAITATPSRPGVHVVAAGRRRRARRRRLAVAGLVVVLLALVGTSLLVGHTTHGVVDAGRAVLGQDVPGVSFTVRELRLPRAVLGGLVGACFGLAGTSFQTLLRNQLAAPDVIGISSGASAAAVVGIVVLSWSPTGVALLAVVAAVGTALAIALLSLRDGAVGIRLVLVGIAVKAMLDSVVASVLSRAAQWDLQVAMRWLTGSLNGATWQQVLPVAVATALLVPVLLVHARDLEVLHHGSDVAIALGVRTRRTQLAVVLSAVGLVAFATAATGPIAFVAFLAGPIATRVVGTGGSSLLPAATTGAVLVLAADLVGQWAFGTRYPVGVVTGALGAPYLVHLLVRASRPGPTT